MRILIIEDTDFKAKECLSCLECFHAECTVVSNEKDAKILLKNRPDFDVILLDMELDLSSVLSEGRGSYSGLSILNTMKYNRIQIPVIVFTAYRNFSEMKPTSDPNNLLFLYNDYYFQANIPPKIQASFDTRYLDGLHNYMCYRYSNYVGVVEYSVYNSIWKRQLQNIIYKCMETKKYENIDC